MIQEPTMKDNPLVVMCSACGVAITKATIQISVGAIFYYRKKTGSLCNSSYSFQYLNDTSDRDETQLLIFVEN